MVKTQILEFWPWETSARILFPPPHTAQLWGTLSWKLRNFDSFLRIWVSVRTPLPCRAKPSRSSDWVCHLRFPSRYSMNSELVDPQPLAFSAYINYKEQFNGFCPKGGQDWDQNKTPVLSKRASKITSERIQGVHCCFSRFWGEQFCPVSSSCLEDLGPSYRTWTWPRFEIRGQAWRKRQTDRHLQVWQRERRTERQTDIQTDFQEWKPFSFFHTSPSQAVQTIHLNNQSRFSKTLCAHNPVLSW